MHVDKDEALGILRQHINAMQLAKRKAEGIVGGSFVRGLGGFRGARKRFVKSEGFAGLQGDGRLTTTPTPVLATQRGGSKTRRRNDCSASLQRSLMHGLSTYCRAAGEGAFDGMEQKLVYAS